MPALRPFYEDVQAHYDLSDDFFALFLDPSRTYSCAYFEREDMSLEQAQLAKIDLSLGKCDLRPGSRLLDIGCGWGSTALRAAQKYRVDVIGLTLSRNQFQTASQRAQDLPSQAGRVEIRLEGWEEFDEPVDRIVSIGAFEHFRKERYEEFFERCRGLLPGDGRMLLHTIVLSSMATLRQLNVTVAERDVEFAKFIHREIFPGGQLFTPQVLRAYMQQAGFRIMSEQSLRLHYARTLRIWAANLRSAREQAIELTSQEVYDRYMKYLTGCSDHFRTGHIDVMQFQLQPA
jgi:cyclopropane-fatty-acyl-phospholipid synthase